jgi:hypothetical protein
MTGPHSAFQTQSADLLALFTTAAWPLAPEGLLTSPGQGSVSSSNLASFVALAEAAYPRTVFACQRAPTYGGLAR